MLSPRSVTPRPGRARPSRRLVALLTAATLWALAATVPAAAVAAPADCWHEKRTASGAIDPTGLCVSYGYGIRPADKPGDPLTRNVLVRAENKVAMPFDYYVRSDIAQEIAAGTARPRAAYLLLYGGAFTCGSRADFASHARELARRGFVVVTPEYPLTGALSAYGYYKPNPAYSQEQRTRAGSNPCGGFSSWLSTPEWNNVLMPRLRSRGLEPALQQSQWVVQELVRALKRNRAYGVDPARIWALGTSAGGAVAIRLALGGNNDQLPSGADRGDSTIAGAISVSGPSCYPATRWLYTPMLAGQIRPSEVPPCRMDLDAADPPVQMIQEPRGAANDLIIPTELMLSGCAALNSAGYGQKCFYEDRLPKDGGYIPDGAHAAVSWSDWMRMFDVLTRQTTGQP